MEKKKVIVFGDLPLSTKIVMFLQDLSYIELVGVVTSPRQKAAVDYFDCACLYDYAASNDIEIFTLEKLSKLFEPKSLDFAILTRYSKILKEPVINLFGERILNFHGGLLPEFAGPNSSCHEILSGDGVAGGTIHLIRDETIDTGEIVSRFEFEISPTDTSESVFKKTQKMFYENFCAIAEDFFFGRIQVMPQSELIAKGHKARYFSKKDLQHELQLDDSIKKTISIHARGLEFFGHERGYITYNGIKIYFTTKNLEFLEISLGTSLSGGGGGG